MTIPPDNPRPDGQSTRRSMRPELSTLTGMATAIASLFLPWTRTSLSRDEMMLPAYFRENESLRTGFQSGVHWLVASSAILCGLTLLAPLTGSLRLPAVFVHGICSLICLMVPLLELVHNGYSPLPGLVTCMVAGGLLLFGLLDRFTAPGWIDNR